MAQNDDGEYLFIQNKVGIRSKENNSDEGMENDNEGETEKKEGLSKGEIIGIVVGSIAFLSYIGLLIGCLL